MCKYNGNILPSSFDNIFQNYTAYMIMAQDNKLHGNYHHKRVRTDYGKKMLQYVGPVAWGCISNSIKMLPLDMFSYRVKSRLLAGY